jgi:hypothetical protein
VVVKPRISQTKIKGFIMGNMRISYEGYRETLARLSSMHRESYKAGHKTANHWRELKVQLRSEYPEHSERYTRETLGFPLKRK